MSVPAGTRFNDIRVTRVRFDLTPGGTPIKLTLNLANGESISLDTFTSLANTEES